MIRFIDIGDQIQDGERHFAFWDTTTDTFVGFGHEKDQPEYAFISMDDFKRALMYSPESTRKRRDWMGYIPDGFFEVHKLDIKNPSHWMPTTDHLG